MTTITQDIEQHSINVCKALMLDTVRKANSGHSGGPLSALDFTYVLYKDFMRFDPDDPMAVRFRWVTQGNKILENWQIAHFRLLGNDAFLPYGSSVLESARRIWRQLILIEDAMLVYRVIRAPERRVFYIDVGNVPPEDVTNYTFANGECLELFPENRPQ